MQAPEQIDLFVAASREHAEGGKKNPEKDKTPPGDHWKLVQLPDAEPGVGFVLFPEGWRAVEVVLIDPPENYSIFSDLKRRGGKLLSKARQAMYRGHAMGWEERFRLAQYRPAEKAWNVRSPLDIVRELDPEAEPWISSLR